MKENKLKENIKKFGLVEEDIVRVFQAFELMTDKERKKFLKVWKEEMKKKYPIFKTEIEKMKILTPKEMKILDHVDMHDIFMNYTTGYFQSIIERGETIAYTTASPHILKHKELIEKKFKIKVFTPDEALRKIEEENELAKKQETKDKSYIG